MELPLYTREPIELPLYAREPNIELHFTPIYISGGGVQVIATPVYEPSSWAMLGVGLVLISYLAWQRRGGGDRTT